jgi:uncharacterized peroxidase-related enzyme
VRAHAHDLRAEVDDDGWVHRIASGRWREAELSDQDRALCAFAEKLTLEPRAMQASDLDVLRSAGLTDDAIHHAVQVIGYFAYINRVADALGVEPEDFVRAWERE